jgi:hypothetical protein
MKPSARRNRQKIKERSAKTKFDRWVYRNNLFILFPPTSDSEVSE